MQWVREPTDTLSGLFHQAVRWLACLQVGVCLLACNAFDDPPDESHDDPIIGIDTSPAPAFITPTQQPTPVTAGAMPAGVQNAPRAATTCGNAILEATEECDDGNREGGDGCSTLCRIERCGDGLLQQDESCDDGNERSEDGCAADCSSIDPGWVCSQPGSPCQATRCGDLVVQGDERCDDGNREPFDGCNGLCQVERYYTCPPSGGRCTAQGACGNQLIEAGETCDDGSRTDGDGCSAECQVEAGYRCPPGHPCAPICSDDLAPDEPGVQADAGALVAMDAGSASVTPAGQCLAFDLGYEYCGDGIVTGQEVCDDGVNATTYGEGCAPGCRAPGSCGDGVADAFAGEECDLGAERNTGQYGGCTAECRRASHCGDGIEDPEEQCDIDQPSCVECRLVIR